MEQSFYTFLPPWVDTDKVSRFQTMAWSINFLLSESSSTSHVHGRTRRPQPLFARLVLTVPET